MISHTASLILLSISATICDAQLFLPASPPTSLECATADSVLRFGSLAAVDSQVTAATLLSGCNTVGANAVAVAMRRRRTAAADNAFPFVFRAVAADTAQLNAALDIAEDAGADSVVRVLSVGVLLNYVSNDETYPFTGIGSYPEGDECGAGPLAPLQFPTSTLPSNVLQIMHNRLATIEHDASQPLSVRSAVNCLVNAWRYASGLPLQPAASFTTIPLTIAAGCSTDFVIHNTLSFSLSPQYSVGASGARTEVMAVGKSSGQSFGESIYDAHAHGATVTLWFDGQVVGSAILGTVPCP